MGGGLRVENEGQYFYVRGLGLLIGHREIKAFKAGISACSVDALPNGNKTTVCRYPDGRISSRAVMARGRLLELTAPCAGGSLCNYKVVAGGFVAGLSSHR